MTDTTINGLSTALAATAATDDLLVIWDTSAGATKKHAAAYVARSDGASGHKLITGSGRELTVAATGTAGLLGTAQTYSAKQTYSAGIDTSQIIPTAYSLASDGVVALSTLTTLTNGILFIVNKSAGQSAIFILRGGINATIEALDPSSAFSGTKDTGSSINVYYDGGYKIQSKNGAIDLLIVMIGSV